MKWASVVSEEPSLEEAVEEAVSSLSADLGDGTPDLAVLFVSSHHAEGFDRIPGLVMERLGPRVLLGCSAGGVIGGGHEVEERPGLSLTVARLPGVELLPFHLEVAELPDQDAPPEAWERLVGASPESSPAFLLLAEPFTFPAEQLVHGLDYAFGGSTKIGGMASSAQGPGGNALYLSQGVHRSGAVGVAMQGEVVVDTIVAQGCRPIGGLMRVTRCQQNLLLELDGRPALEVLQELLASLEPRDQGLARHSLFLGMVMDPLQETFSLGDFLIRNILGVDQGSGALAIGELLQEGRLAQFHLRDAQTSAEELDGLLTQYTADRHSDSTWGSLLFSCVGRGQYLYGRPDHDTGLFHKRVGDVPLGGFFCNGEIGPVGGATFMHGYTSSFGIFRPKPG